MSTRRLCALALLLGTLVPFTGCRAQVPNVKAQIDGALLAAPEHLRDGATVYGYDEDGALVTIREGSGELICLADQPGDDRFHAACYHTSLEPYMKRGRELRAEGLSGRESIEKRHEEAEAGTLEMPSEPAAVYTVSVPIDEFDPATAKMGLYAVYIPYATAASTGLPETAGPPGTPWLMRPGTPSAHIMIVPPEE